MTAVAPPVKSSRIPLALQGPSTHARLPGEAGIQRMILWGVALWAFFLFGDALARRRGTSDVNFARPLEAAMRDGAAWTVVLTGGAVGLGLFGAAWATVNRAILFTGYANLQETAAAGALQAAIAFMTYISVITVLLNAAMPRFVVGLALLVLGFLGMLALSIGERQTFVLSLIAALVSRSALRGGVPRSMFVGLTITGVLLFGSLVPGDRVLPTAVTCLEALRSSHCLRFSAIHARCLHRSTKFRIPDTYIVELWQHSAECDMDG